MPVTLINAILVDIDPLRAEAGELRIDSNKIVARGKSIRQVNDEVIDVAGAVVLPGMVNGHTHLYSALAVGMPAPPRIPRNFLEILQLVWWRLDRALDAESNETSARIGAIEALRCGTTTLIDHHASPNAIDGSLDQIERGIESVGLRGVLCYETTDRNGRDGRDAGVAENRRYLTKCAARNDGKFAGLVGAHAAFTLEDESLEALEELAEEFQVGVHIHVAEDPCDEAACTRDHQVALIERLHQHWLLKRDSIFAHGTHLSDAAIAQINEIGLTIAHNARSNMNNAVGYSPIGKINSPVMLGTDGIGGDMFAEMKTAWFKSRDGRAGISPADVITMLANSARRASQSLGVTLGKLEPGAAADVVVTDYIPFTPIESSNLVGHLLFSIESRHVRDVMVDGRWAMRDGKVIQIDEAKTRRDALRVSRELWKRLDAIAP
ncbi:MAG: amidohydrolase family protein [Anaerolineae bacterium]|nr:amidohydrolase family protein [Phycisphaerae bacterium]